MKIPMCRPWLTQEDYEAVERTLRSGVLSSGGGGPEVERLESEFARIHGYKNAVAVSSGGMGLWMMTSRLNGTVSITGATFPGVYNHLACGIKTCDMGDDDEGDNPIATALYHSSFVEPATERPVLADYCEAVGCSPVGHCDCVYSFYPNKQLAGGEGGIICTNSADRARWYRSARNNGRRGAAWEPAQWGMNMRMSELTAALVRSQLCRLETILEYRRARWLYYKACLNRPTCELSISIFAYLWMADSASHRERVAARLRGAGIESRRTFPPTRRADHPLPLWKQFYDTTLLLPFYTTMPLSEIETVCREIRHA